MKPSDSKQPSPIAVPQAEVTNAAIRTPSAFVARTQAIVLVHGFGANRVFTWPLQRRLMLLGYRVANVRYFSLQSIPRSVPRVVSALQGFSELPEVETIHFVGHSMGCILGRVALETFRPKNFGRMVMMTPPTKGSPIANKLAPLLGRWIAPLYELGTAADSFVNSLKPPDYPFAIVRATNDFIVPPDFETLENAQDHFEIPGRHSAVLFSRQVSQQIHCYLQNGKFQVDP